MKKKGSIKNKDSENISSLVLWIKYFSWLWISDEKLVWLLRDYFNIKITSRTIRKYKQKFNKKNLT